MTYRFKKGISMSKYDALARTLSELDGDSITLPFSRINELLPGGLPQSAYDHRPWWANRSDGSGSQSQGWQSVGLETSDVDMDAEKVTFNRVVKKQADFKDASYVKPLSIEEAKQGLALMFNVDYRSINITING
jgi:hypothetical protein